MPNMNPRDSSSSRSRSNSNNGNGDDGTIIVGQGSKGGGRGRRFDNPLDEEEVTLTLLSSKKTTVYDDDDGDEVPGLRTISFSSLCDDGEIGANHENDGTKIPIDSNGFMSGWMSKFGPPHMANILITELCERYSFYALRSILVLFFSEEIGWSDDASVSVVFFSASLTYFMPLLGGWVADSKSGKFKAILWFCVVYIFGSATLTIAAGAKSAFIAILGLVLIAVGTGGIKPNVSAFGADQLKDCEPEVKERFFRVFYFSINVGSFFSYIVSPLLRKHLGYPVAFGVPTLFLGLATYTFWSARRSYVKIAPDGSPIAVVFGTMRTAFRRRHRDNDDGTTSDDVSGAQHWIERAKGGPDGHGERDVKDSLAVWRVSKVLAVLPIFWMLYDQQASAWTLQAERMDLHGLQPEQMGVVNPVLVLALIPLFDQVIYPRWGASSFLPSPTPLRKIGLGMLICASAFVVSAVVEGMIASASEENSVSVFLQLPQLFILSVSEILVSITGLEFAYEQAPPSMKSCVMALFLVTTAVGDLLGGGLYSGLGSEMSPAGLFVLCAVAMIANTVLFVYVAKRFRSTDDINRPSRSLLSSASKGSRRPSYDSLSSKIDSDSAIELASYDGS